jgi:hypothetical protein
LVANWRRAFLICLAVPTCASSFADAQQVYRSVDADGQVVYSDRAGLAAVEQPLPATQQALDPPGVLHFCWTNCFTLTLQNGLYLRADGTTETWTIERFTPASFVLHRHGAPAAWNGFSADVTYAGSVSGDRLINVTVAGAPVPDIGMTWGRALDTLPGSNAERDRRSEVANGAGEAARAPAPGDGELTGLGDARATEAPPSLPDDDQPPVPQDGYLWTPGRWVWRIGGYYWVPGVWVLPPRAGLLWTPGYWVTAGAFYAFHAGYWGPHVGFYGGINYGYGYSGTGYAGGHWVGSSFAYNQAVSNVNGVRVASSYREPVASIAATSRTSFNGGAGGISAAPTATERVAAAEPHFAATPQQRQLAQRFAGQPTMKTPARNRPPSVAALPKAAAVKAPRVVRATTKAPPAAGDSPAERAAPSVTSRAAPAVSKPADAKASHAVAATAIPAR